MSATTLCRMCDPDRGRAFEPASLRSIEDANRRFGEYANGSPSDRTSNQANVMPATDPVIKFVKRFTNAGAG